jgi:hypothetical protein
VASTNSKACRDPGDCSPWRRDRPGDMCRGGPQGAPLRREGGTRF